MTGPAAWLRAGVLGALLALPGGQVPAQDAADAVGALAGEEAVDRLRAVLEDDAARAALLAALEAAGAPEAEPAPDEGLRLTAAASGAARAVAADLGRAGREVLRVGTLPERLRRGLEGRGPEAAGLIATILSTIAASLAFGHLAGRAARGLRPSPSAGTPARLRGAALALGLRLGAVALAWGVGTVLAARVFDGNGGEAQRLYLDAFAAFGALRVALRAFADPDAGWGPALSTLDPRAQGAIHRALVAVAGVTMHGFLFVVPLVALWGGFAAARPVRTLVATLAAAMALWSIRRVAQALDRSPNEKEPPEALSSLWRRLWPVLAVLYVGYCWLVALIRPALLAEIVVGGTLLTALALGLLIAGLRLLRRAPSLRAPLPATALPGLAPRADRIASVLGRVAGGALVLAAVMVAVGAWGPLDLGEWAARPAVAGAAWRVLSALLVLALAAVLWAVVASWIDARLADDGDAPSARTRTLLTLFRNAFTVALAVIASMVALSRVGLDIAPLLAGAGVIGLAIGFGSQTLVKDIITGVFIQLERAIDVGDVVGVAGVTGGVEALTIRSVRLRTLDGAVHVIPFSAVGTVTNLTRDFSYHVAELTLGYGDDVSRARDAMESAFARLLDDPLGRDVDGPLDMQGIVEMRASAVILRARVRTRPGRQWDVGRRYAALLQAILAERGIEIPQPARIVVLSPEPAPHAGVPPDTVEP